LGEAQLVVHEESAAVSWLDQHSRGLLATTALFIRQTLTVTSRFKVEPDSLRILLPCLQQSIRLLLERHPYTTTKVEAQQLGAQQLGAQQLPEPQQQWHVHTPAVDSLDDTGKAGGRLSGPLGHSVVTCLVNHVLGET
jgi:hypothetical protein